MIQEIEIKIYLKFLASNDIQITTLCVVTGEVLFMWMTLWHVGMFL